MSPIRDAVPGNALALTTIEIMQKDHVMPRSHHWIFDSPMKIETVAQNEKTLQPIRPNVMATSPHFSDSPREWSNTEEHQKIIANGIESIIVIPLF